MLFRSLIASCRLALRRRRYRAGATLTRFVAKDIRRDVEVVDATDLEIGFIAVRVRTWNVFYVANGRAAKPDFSPPQWISLYRLWAWKGAQWGGPVPAAAEVGLAHYGPSPDPLAGLDAIDWASLDHAHGSAKDVPQFLRGLRASSEGGRDEALHDLFESVWHQGTVYSASAHVVPFLAELIEAPETKEKSSLVSLLASIAGGRGYYEMHEDVFKRIGTPSDAAEKRGKEARVVRAVRRAVSPHVPLLIAHLSDPSFHVRLPIVDMLPLYPEHHDSAKAALESLRAMESDPDVIEAIDEALAAMAGKG